MTDTNEEFFEENDSALVIDMDAVQEVSFEALPAGLYECIIEDVKYGPSKAGKPMWSLTLAVVDGNYSNRKLFQYISFSEKAIGMAKSTIRKIAPQLLTKSFNPSKIAENGTLVGIAVRAKVTVEQYQGNPTNRVKDLLGTNTGDGDEFLNS